MQNKQNKKKKKWKWIYFLLAFILLFVIGGYYGNQWAKKYGFKNLWDFLSTTGSNYSKSFKAEYEEINIEISDKDYAKLEKLREQALKRGIIVNTEDGEYVPAEIIHKGKKIKSEIRLKGHMTDHLQKNKWSFRVKTKKGDAFLGMKRFTLQHPGTRNYVNEWIYHKLMESQGIIALRYMFIKVKVNGSDWGIYALEEHFGQELAQNNLRLPGPVIRYNPDLFWVHRINEKDKIRIVEEFANMQNANIDAYDFKTVLSDSSLLNNFISALQLLEEFRRGVRKTSEAFDILKLAKFHAIIDIVGGHHSLDWSDVKYYYNPATQLLEPVAYESFGAQPVKKISGTYKYFADSTVGNDDHHAMLFSDKEFFETYIRELNKLSKDGFLEKFFKDIDTELQNNLAILYKEFPYKNFSNKIYFNNLKNIQKILDSPQGFYAHYSSMEDSIINLSIGSVESLPFEIKEIKIDTTIIQLKEKIIIPSKKPGTPVIYTNYRIPMGMNIAVNEKTKLKVSYHLLGYDKTKEQEIFLFHSYSESSNRAFYMQQKENIDEFGFIIKNNNEYFVTPGKHIIDKDLILGKGKSLRIEGGTGLILNNHSKIISYSPLYFSGSEEYPVIITTSDSTGQGIILSGVKERSEFKHVVFQSLKTPSVPANSHNGVLNMYESKVLLDNCIFTLSGKDAFFAARSDVMIKNSLFKMTGRNAINLFFCKGEINNAIIENAKNDGIKMNGSYVRISGLIAEKIKGIAISAEEYSESKIFKSKISESSIGVEARDRTIIDIDNLTLEECETGFKSHQKGNVFGASQISVKNLREKNNKKLKMVEKGSEITIN